MGLILIILSLMGMVPNLKSDIKKDALKFNTDPPCVHLSLNTQKLANVITKILDAQINGYTMFNTNNF